MTIQNLTSLPGGDLIAKGLEDLARAKKSEESLLVLIGAPRLRSGGLEIERVAEEDPERALYEMLAKRHGDDAHSQYNALIRLLVSFEDALECANRYGPLSSSIS